ncbi:MAG: M23 family metallopeptidase [Alphaproteobacteria bacterium]
MTRALPLALMLVLAGTIAWADAPRLSLPIACAPGKDCWVVNYVDLDEGPGRRDYRCGQQTYDKHNGTDIAIRDTKAMGRGVPVLAAAAGTVKALRDGVDDANFRSLPPEAIAKRECGNGVILDHGDGWQTQYCHLRKGSVRVRRGDRVAAGDALGLVGMSGKTEFPHLHVTLRHEGKVVDPFVGQSGGERCQAGKAPLWEPATLARLEYRPGAVYAYGIAPDRPDAEKARAGELDVDRLPADADALVAWADIYNVAKGDSLRIELSGPDGKSIARLERTFDKDQSRVFQLAGRKRRGEAWPAGTYEAEILYRRADGSGNPPVRVRVEVR